MKQGIIQDAFGLAKWSNNKRWMGITLQDIGYIHWVDLVYWIYKTY